MELHFRSYVDFYGPKKALNAFRKFFGWYGKGISGVRHLRHEAFGTKTKDAMLGVIENSKLLKRMARMNKEFSAGAVVFRKEDKKILFLLVYSKRNKTGAFQKGIWKRARQSWKPR